MKSTINHLGFVSSKARYFISDINFLNKDRSSEKKRYRLLILLPRNILASYGLCTMIYGSFSNINLGHSFSSHASEHLRAGENTWIFIIQVFNTFKKTFTVVHVFISAIKFLIFLPTLIVLFFIHKVLFVEFPLLEHYTEEGNFFHLCEK